MCAPVLAARIAHNVLAQHLRQNAWIFVPDAFFAAAYAWQKVVKPPLNARVVVIKLKTNVLIFIVGVILCM